jgi:Family of unknown function (DUF6390)
MTTIAHSGWQLFASYAYPPNELGYCGPPDSSVLLAGDGSADIANHARGFDGVWTYLEEIAAAAGVGDPLDADVVRNYWLGGELLARVDGERLVTRLRDTLSGQPTGLLNDPNLDRQARAEHSFHVFAVYPWIGFLGKGDPSTPLRVLQSCRIRWGTVDSVDDERAVIISRPLHFDGSLSLGDEMPESVRWARDGASLTSRPAPGQTVSAHWDWVCGSLTAGQRDTLASATMSTLALVNRLRG